MQLKESLKKVLASFEGYYTVKTEEVEPPFEAFAEFHAHGEQYFLSKKAKLADIDTNEYVYFVTLKNLTEEQLFSISETAWQNGLKRVKPYSGHRNSDISLVILAAKADAKVSGALSKIRNFKSYKFGFWGWSAYNVAVFDFSSQKCFSNSRGEVLKRNLGKILCV